MECPENCPMNIYDLMRKCWQWEPVNRPTFEQIYKDLENMFHDASTALPVNMSSASPNNSLSSTFLANENKRDYISSTLPTSNNQNHLTSTINNATSRSNQSNSSSSLNQQNQVQANVSASFSLLKKLKLSHLFLRF